MARLSGAFLYLSIISFLKTADLSLNSDVSNEKAVMVLLKNANHGENDMTLVPTRPESFNYSKFNLHHLTSEMKLILDLATFLTSQRSGVKSDLDRMSQQSSTANTGLRVFGPLKQKLKNCLNPLELTSFASQEDLGLNFEEYDRHMLEYANKSPEERHKYYKEIFQIISTPDRNYKNQDEITQSEEEQREERVVPGKKKDLLDYIIERFGNKEKTPTGLGVFFSSNSNQARL